MPKNKIRCPICNCLITKNNPLVKYHIRYSPPLVTFACKYCNYTEYALRNEHKPLPKCAIAYPQWGTFQTRAARVILFHKLVGVPI